MPDLIWIIVVILLVFWLAGIWAFPGVSLIHLLLVLLVLLVVALLFEFLYRRPRL